MTRTELIRNLQKDIELDPVKATELISYAIFAVEDVQTACSIMDKTFTVSIKTGIRHPVSTSFLAQTLKEALISSAEISVTDKNGKGKTKHYDDKNKVIPISKALKNMKDLLFMRRLLIKAGHLDHNIVKDDNGKFILVRKFHVKEFPAKKYGNPLLLDVKDMELIL